MNNLILMPIIIFGMVTLGYADTQLTVKPVWVVPPPAGIWPQNAKPLTGNDSQTSTFETIGGLGLSGGQAIGSDSATMTFETIGGIGLSGGQATGSDSATSTFETIGNVSAANAKLVGTGD